LVARRSQWFTGSRDSAALQRRVCPWGHTVRGVRSKTSGKQELLGPDLWTPKRRPH
jgi:hypothetical protein